MDTSENYRKISCKLKQKKCVTHFLGLRTKETRIENEPDRQIRQTKKGRQRPDERDRQSRQTDKKKGPVKNEAMGRCWLD